MGEAQEVQLSVTAQEANEANRQGHTNGSINQSPIPDQPRRKLMSWIRIGIYAVFVLAGQSAGNLLGRLYYEKGGNSNWTVTLVQLAGFPILLPYYFLLAKKNKNAIIETDQNMISPKRPSTLVVASIYILLGLLLAADGYFYSIGLMYLPVSTYSLILASQLAFNAFFSFFLNSQKFTFYIINSLVLLTLSSILLVFQSGSDDTHNNSKGKYAIGFICTVGASAGYGLVLSLTQFFLNRVLKRESFSVVMDIIVYQSLVASLAILVGLLASGGWKGLDEEMNSFELGKLSYVMTLVWTAIIWQLYTIGVVGLILEVSALFSNVMIALGLPIVPVLAVFFFHEKMDGIKVMAMFLAIWGFISYIYQNYLDDYCSKKESSQKAIREHELHPIEKERSIF
ncbi:probable purine permease 10 isoform X2 [Morus notabilis]|uniref:probable purine permease 10 isoform X2 n=1 Tax=Morus notabilis TaxID=981085 RepID=UPI000CED1939|nr:probable purine permease 10 isoform X2 [Morus notabilis]